MKRKIISILFIMFIIIMLNTYSLAVVCNDIKKDGYDIMGILNNGGIDFKDAAGQVTDANFIDMYDFFINGVDIEKIKSNNLQDEYTESLQLIMQKLEAAQGANATSAEGADVAKQLEAKYGTTIENEKAKVSKILEDVGASEDDKNDIEQSYDDLDNMHNASNSTNKQDAVDAVEEATKNDKKWYIYKNPEIADSTKTGEESIDDLITDGEEFLNNVENDEEIVQINSLQDFSKTYYNILLIIGIVASVIVGMILGIKLMLAGPEGKAEVKQYFVPYIVGCVVIFAGFGIWKLVITLLQQV